MGGRKGGEGSEGLVRMEGWRERREEEGRSTQHMKTAETSVAPKCSHVDIKSATNSLPIYHTLRYQKY